ncbi:MAG: HAMP domain-containing protein [Rhodocyclaceae bacterium]
MQNIDFGRFEQSFMFHMLRDFFLLLVAVTVIEMGVRFGMVIYEFSHHDRQTVELAANQLATDVKSIMLNSGGPVAARTVYPILKRNLEDLGLSVAIVPTPVTVASMQAKFQVEPHGIPPQWPSGRHNETRVTLAAEEFCLTCHVKAKVGDVLGEITVRSYFSRRVDTWWSELRLTAVIWIINIFTHTIVLFLLLKIRMEPLLALRATVSRLAKGIINLSHRAKVNSHDEFGELAQDLNHFLDRITQVVEDLDGILSRVVAVGHRLSQVSQQMDAHFAKINDAGRAALRESLADSGNSATALREESVSMVALLDSLTRQAALADADRGRLMDVSARLHSSLRLAEFVLAGTSRAADEVVVLSREVHSFGHFFVEMALLEQRMQAVAESGQALLARLTNGGATPPAA